MRRRCKGERRPAEARVNGPKAMRGLRAQLRYCPGHPFNVALTGHPPPSRLRGYGVGDACVQHQVHPNAGLVPRLTDKEDCSKHAAFGHLHVLKRAGLRYRIPMLIHAVHPVSQSILSVYQDFIKRATHCDAAWQIRECNSEVLSSTFNERRIPHVWSSQPAIFAMERATTGLTVRCRGRMIVAGINSCR